MKTNEAPEKIYIQLPSRNWIGNIWNETPIKEGDNPNWKNATNVEYTRTDAFIEKALKWLEENVMKYLITTIHAGMDVPDIKDKFFDDFKNYMKGE